MVIRLGAIAAEKHADTKELVVEILGCEFPLTVKRICNTINKHYGRQVSYHAVYKAINTLLNAKVIAKQGTKYSLNKKYIKGICDFANKVNVLYGEEKLGVIDGFPKENFLLRKFSSQYEMGMFILDILNDCKRDEIIAIVWPTVWPPLINVKEMGSKIRNITSKTSEVYCVCGRSGFLDRLFAKKWKDLGMKVKLGVQLSQIFEIFAFRDMTIFFLQPHERRFQKYKYLHLIKNLDFLKTLDVFLPILQAEPEIYSSVVQNSEIADNIKQEVLDCF